MANYEFKADHCEIPIYLQNYLEKSRVIFQNGNSAPNGIPTTAYVHFYTYIRYTCTHWL